MSDVVTVEPTQDLEYVESVFLSPAIYRQMSDDSCPPAESLAGAFGLLGGMFMKCLVNGVPCGAFWLRDKGDDMEVHTALLENCRGRNAIRAAKSLTDWVFGNTDHQRIVSYSWSDSPAVAWFCRACGMTPTTTENWPSTRNGMPVEVTHFQITKPITP